MDTLCTCTLTLFPVPPPSLVLSNNVFNVPNDDLGYNNIGCSKSDAWAPIRGNK